MDIATLGIKIENGDVVKATTSLEGMAVAGGKSEAAAQRLTRRMALLEIEARNMNAAMAAAATANRYAARDMALMEIEARKMDATMGRMNPAITKLAGAFTGLSVVMAVGFIGRKTIEETEQAQAALAQLEAAVKSTGGVAGRTVAQLDDLSMAMQRQTTYSDEAVKGAEAMLLTFDKIRGANFDRATAAVSDLAARMGGDLQGAAVQVGKALQDPTTGLTALRRSGVSFSASQMEVIKDLYDTGRAAEGQRVILKELEHQFGGSAAAARNTLGGALAGLKNAWGDLFEVTKGGSKGLVDGINAIADALAKVGPMMDRFISNTVAGWRVLSIDLSKGLSNFLKERDRILADARAAAPTGPLGKVGPDSNDLSEAAQKFAALRKEREEELGKLAALNGAYRQADVALSILGITYDAAIQKAKDAKEHHGAELATLNHLTDAITRQRIAQVQLNDQLAREKELRTTQRGTMEDTRAAQQGLELTRLAAAQVTRTRAGLVTTDDVARRRIDLDQENGLLAARLDFAEKTIRATEEQTAAAQAEYASTVQRVNATHDLAMANQGVLEVMQRVQQVTEVSKGLIFDALQSLGKKGANIFQDWWDAGRRGLNQFVADIVGAKIGQKFGDMMGLGPSAAGTKQAAAGAVMLQAAQLQVAAANAMLTAAGKPPVGGSPSSAGVTGATGSQAMRYGGAALAGLGVGYGVGTSLYSPSHGDMGNYLRGGLGGAASGAAAGFMIAGPAGAAAGAITGLVGGILGMGSAAKAAAKAMAEAQTQVALSMAALRADVAHDTIASSVAAINADREQRRKAIEDAYSGGGANSQQVKTRNTLLAEMNRLEDQRIQQIIQESQAMKVAASEDLRVRTLRNQGQQHDADVLAKQLEDQREYAKAVADQMDPTYLAQLKWNEAIEENAVATGKASDAIGALTSGLNEVAGYKDDITRMIFSLRMPPGTGSGYDTPFGGSPASALPPLPSSPTPQPLGRMGGVQSSSDAPTGDLTVPLVIDGVKVGETVLKNFRRLAAARFGDTTRWSEL